MLFDLISYPQLYHIWWTRTLHKKETPVSRRPPRLPRWWDCPISHAPSTTTETCTWTHTTSMALPWKIVITVLRVHSVGSAALAHQVYRHKVGSFIRSMPMCKGYWGWRFWWYSTYVWNTGKCYLVLTYTIAPTITFAHPKLNPDQFPLSLHGPHHSSRIPTASHILPPATYCIALLIGATLVAHFLLLMFIILIYISLILIHRVWNVFRTYHQQDWKQYFNDCTA